METATADVLLDRTPVFYTFDFYGKNDLKKKASCLSTFGVSARRRAHKAAFSLSYRLQHRNVSRCAVEVETSGLLLLVGRSFADQVLDDTLVGLQMCAGKG
jgi:hypothetical protein